MLQIYDNGLLLMVIKCLTFCMQLRLFIAITDAGFRLTDEQKERQKEMQDWLDNEYRSEVYRQTVRLKEAKAELRRLERNEANIIMRRIRFGDYQQVMAIKVYNYFSHVIDSQLGVANVSIVFFQNSIVSSTLSPHLQSLITFTIFIYNLTFGQNILI